MMCFQRFYKIIFITIALISTGCVSLSKNAKAVKIVEPIELTEMDKCTDRGIITSDSELSEKNAYRLLINKAADSGANVIASRLRVSSGVDATYIVKGRAFTCPPEIYSSLSTTKLEL